MADIIQIRGGLSTEAATTNPVLASRELAFETDTKKGKIGDGVTAYNSLPYSWTGEVFIDSLNSSTVKTLPADGDKIAVSDSEASGVLKHYTWAGIKARLKTYFDTIYSITVGTVTSVGASVPTGLSISGSPITSSGVLAISFTAGYSIPTTANQANWGTAYTHSQVVTGSVHGSTAVGEALLRLANPSAIRFLRINADNTATALTAADFLTAIGAQPAGSYANSSHVHSASDITSGTLAVDRGGTGIGSYTANNYIRALSSFVLEQRTPAQVLTDIGAAAASHSQNASTIQSGTFATGNFVFPNNLEISGQSSSAVFAKGNSGTGTVTFNWNDSNFQTVTLNGNCTFAFSNPQSGASYQIVVTNDGTVRTVILPTVYWRGGTLPVFTGTLNAVDMITLTYDGSKYIGSFSPNHKV